MRAAWAAVLVVACGCARDVDIGVKVSRQMTMPLSAGQAAALSPQDLANLAGIGITLKDTTLVFPELQLPGYWVELDGQRTMLDENAVTILHGAREAKATVYEDFGSTDPIGDFKLGDAAGKDWPVPMVLSAVLPVPGDMQDPNALSMMGAPGTRFVPQADLSNCLQRPTAHCAAGDNAAGCCLDYDNPAGDGKAYWAHIAPECDDQKLINFIPSTCFAWVAATACVDEAAFGRGPHCWEHHKYRNCQNLSLTDFSIAVPGSTHVRPGQTTTLKLRNNLPANDTRVVISAPLEKPGTLSNPTGAARLLPQTANAYVVEHYDDGAQKHTEETMLTYTAPPLADLPAVCSTIEVTISVWARTFEPVDGTLGIVTDVVLPHAPLVKTDQVKLQIDCNQTAPDLHLHWQLSNNAVHPVLRTDLFDVTAEVDLGPVTTDPNVVTYAPTGGSLTATWVPYDPQPGDPCTYDATYSGAMLPPPPPAFLSISTRPPGILSSVGGVPVTVILTRTCPDPMGGPDISDITTSMGLFPIMNLMGGPTGVLSGSLEEVAAGGLSGTLPQPDGSTISYALSAR